MKLNGIVQLSAVPTSQEVLDVLGDGDFDQVFIDCASFDDRENAQGTYELIKESFVGMKVDRNEPIVVSIASAPPADRNKLSDFFQEAGIPTVALTFERYAAQAKK